MTRGRAVMLAGLVVVAGVVAAAVWFSRRPAPITPPLPAEILEDEVRLVIERAHGRVVAKPTSAADWGYLGMMLLAHLFDREADVCFAQAARLDANDPTWVYARGLIAQKRDPNNALPYLREAARLGESSSRQEDYQLQYAEALLERQQLDEASEQFSAVRRRDPNNARAALGLALLALGRGDDEQAKGLFLVAIRSPCARKATAAHLAALTRASDPEASAKYAKLATDLPSDPPWPDPLLDDLPNMQVGRRQRDRQVKQLEDAGRFAEAAQVFLDLVATKPTAEACIGAGINLVRLRDFERAMPLLERAVKLEPDSAQSRYALALGLFFRAEVEADGKKPSLAAKAWFREAITHARKATEVRPDHARAYSIWGLCHLHLSEPGEAIAPLRKGLACLPGDIQLQLNLGEALLATGDVKEARAHLQSAARSKPDDPGVKKALAGLAEKEKKEP